MYLLGVTKLSTRMGPALCVVLISACGVGDDEQQMSEERLGEIADELRNAGAEINAADTAGVQIAGLPADFPEDIFVPEGYAQCDSFRLAGVNNGRVLACENPQPTSRSAVAAQVSEQMTGLGWTLLTSSEKFPDGWTVNFEKDQRRAGYLLSETDGYVDLQITTMTVD